MGVTFIWDSPEFSYIGGLPCSSVASLLARLASSVLPSSSAPWTSAPLRGPHFNIAVPKVPSGHALSSGAPFHDSLSDTRAQKSISRGLSDICSPPRRPLSIRPLHSSKDDVFGHVTHTVARGPLFDPEWRATATCIFDATLYILELPYAPGPR